MSMTGWFEPRTAGGRIGLVPTSEYWSIVAVPTPWLVRVVSADGRPSKSPPEIVPSATSEVEAAVTLPDSRGRTCQATWSGALSSRWVAVLLKLRYPSYSSRSSARASSAAAPESSAQSRSLAP